MATIWIGDIVSILIANANESSLQQMKRKEEMRGLFNNTTASRAHHHPAVARAYLCITSLDKLQDVFGPFPNLGSESQNA